MSSMRLLGFIIAASLLASEAAAEEIVVKAAKVYTGTGAPLVPGAVWIKDGKVKEVAATIAPPQGVKVVDLGNGVLLPGFVDAHTSIGVEGGAAEATTEITPSFRVLDAVDWSARSFRQARRDGITTVAIAPGSDNVIAGLSCIVKTAGDRTKRVVRADHALVIALASDPFSGNTSRQRPDSIYIRQPTNRMGVVWMLRNELARAKDSTAKDSVPVREALAGKRPVVCVSRVDCDMLAALRLRQEHPVNLTIAGGQEAYKLRAELAAAKIPVLLGPQSTAAGSGPEGSETLLNQAGPLQEAGVAFALTGGELLEQARLAVRFGLSKEAAVSAITSSPAKLLGLQDRLGTVAAGRDADLVALTGDPFDLTSTVRWTMIDGVMHAEEP
jgi:imidazolonepropionase-like amidohydrolase